GHGSNYSPQFVVLAAPRLCVTASHGNGVAEYDRQVGVAADSATGMAGGPARARMFHILARPGDSRTLREPCTERRGARCWLCVQRGVGDDGCGCVGEWAYGHVDERGGLGNGP